MPACHQGCFSAQLCIHNNYLFEIGAGVGSLEWHNCICRVVLPNRWGNDRKLANYVICKLLAYARTQIAKMSTTMPSSKVRTAWRETPVHSCAAKPMLAATMSAIPIFAPQPTVVPRSALPDLSR